MKEYKHEWNKENIISQSLLEFHHHLEQMTKSHVGHACFSYTARDYPKSFSFDIWGPHPLNDWLLHRDTKWEEAFKSHFDPLQTLPFDWGEAVGMNRDKYNVEKAPVPRQEECQHKSCRQQASSSFYTPANKMRKVMSHSDSQRPQAAMGEGMGTSRGKLIDETKSHIRCAKSLGLWSVSVATGFWMTLKLKIQVNCFLFLI